MKKTVLITGASTGFGRLAADELHRKGHQVFGTSRNPSNHQCDFNLLEMDVTDQKSIDAAVAQVISEVGKIDVLVNNAGVLLLGPLEEASEAEIKQIFDVNFFGVVNTTHAVLPHMRKARSGRIINITSLAGVVETPTFGFYCATKHAVEGYTKSLFYEVEPFNIEVGLIKPGEYGTNIFASAVFSGANIPDYDGLRGAMKTYADRVQGEGLADAKAVGLCIANAVEASKLKTHTRIGKFSGMIPILNLFPNLLKKIVRKDRELDKIL